MDPIEVLHAKDQPMANAMDAYTAFDRRELGWLQSLAWRFAVIKKSMVCYGSAVAWDRSKSGEDASVVGLSNVP